MSETREPYAIREPAPMRSCSTCKEPAVHGTYLVIDPDGTLRSFCSLLCLAAWAEDAQILPGLPF